MIKNKWLRLIILVIGSIFILNYPMTYRVGIDGEVVEKRIPFYAKVSGFLYRDWMYKETVARIVDKGEDDERKVLAILQWTNKNILRGAPAGLKIIDDHPLNIIIRQYGTEDQIDDVFTILCSYAGMKAGMNKCFNSDKSHFIYLSLIRVKNKWLVFDASENKYFLNKEGKIGSVRDCLRGDIVLSDKDRARYKEFLDSLKNIDYLSLTRAEEQMPFRRPFVQIKKIFVRKKNNEK